MATIRDLARDIHHVGRYDPEGLARYLWDQGWRKAEISEDGISVEIAIPSNGPVSEKLGDLNYSFRKPSGNEVTPDHIARVISNNIRQGYTAN